MALAKSMKIKLFEHQEKAITKIKNGSILCGGVGSGKSRTALAYYIINERNKDVYVITTARKRDTFDWEREAASLLVSTKKNIGLHGTRLIVDSWNNIKKYVDVQKAFFIFDEQRVVGSGAWVKSFLKITKKNNWILLTATPGDSWMDYIPVFIANGFYKNRTEFLRQHVIYNSFLKFPKVDRYVEQGKLLKLRQMITVNMKYEKQTIPHNEIVFATFSEDLFNQVTKRRWNVYKNKPIRNISELCYLMRKVVNIDESRLRLIKQIIKKRSKVIIFYNFDYELDILRSLPIQIAEWNGHKHEPIPKTKSWAYLVQYTAGAEGWNCIDTNAIIFYSQNYSYKTMVQAAGRIDRLNTPFTDLYYYHIRSKSEIDVAITKALDQKQNFNEKSFSLEKHMLL